MGGVGNAGAGINGGKGGNGGAAVVTGGHTGGTGGAGGAASPVCERPVEISQPGALRSYAVRPHAGFCDHVPLPARFIWDRVMLL